MRTNLTRVLRIIQEFRKHDPELQTQAAQMFLEIALNEGRAVTEIAERIDVAGATASRNIHLLGHKHRSGRPGLGLVEQRVDPQDNRRSLVYLTKKGKLVAETLAGYIGD